MQWFLTQLLLCWTKYTQTLTRLSGWSLYVLRCVHCILPRGPGCNESSSRWQEPPRNVEHMVGKMCFFWHKPWSNSCWGAFSSPLYRPKKQQQQTAKMLHILKSPLLHNFPFKKRKKNMLSSRATVGLLFPNFSGFSGRIHCLWNFGMYYFLNYSNLLRF